MGKDVKMIFLHHSTGENIWNGGVAEWFGKYNIDNGANYQIIEQNFPKDHPYGWENYPYDYWNIWVDHAGHERFREEPTLEILTGEYDVVIWKHCFPVCYMEEDIGSPDVSSSERRMENYKLQYAALKKKMWEFSNTKFIVWTGAAQVKNSVEPTSAELAKSFFNWVKGGWSEPGDNVYIWDFYELETEGGLYFKERYAMDPHDSHPNNAFSRRVVPLFCRRIVDVIEGRGDNSSITGR